MDTCDLDANDIDLAIQDYYVEALIRESLLKHHSKLNFTNGKNGC